MSDRHKRYLPVFLDLAGRRAVLIGESPAIDRRVRQLMRYGAEITVITPKASGALRDAAAQELLTLHERAYVRGDLDGAFYVQCMVKDEEVCRAVFEEGDAAGCLVNVSGSDELRNFLLPSVIHREPLQVAISTGGCAPEAAKAVKQGIEAALGQEWVDWINLLIDVREAPISPKDPPDQREREIAIVAREQTRERIFTGEYLTARDIQGQAKAERLREDLLAKAEAVLTGPSTQQTDEGEDETGASEGATDANGDSEA